MFADLRQFVPSAVCLKCDGCCRFKEADSRWRPHITPEEIAAAARQGLAEKILRSAVAADGRIKTTCASGEHLCSYFNPADHACRIYQARPFECRLYPFILNKQNDQIAVCVHLPCPHIQATETSPQFQTYVSYLEEYFSRRDVQKFIGQNPALVADYSAYQDELKTLFIIRSA
ncbi:MAG: hypothetical protein A2787_09040 [Omnitrophica WOR_2 bacterium RIFCSPHIGHO2_01_FULL_48_9]|nr:MAG: hypothetical protein A3D10_02275 [Omnitrophica WOR_2 bacterium RIFCSPHIGHO2_02_FULL_48_11]OGX30216.1 MAG: hypothetical protein A2787_09040 [Omnitrophica WOR_2 bacterium RIFCSPHIGHO2_01_FULL_48_9]